MMNKAIVEVFSSGKLSLLTCVGITIILISPHMYAQSSVLEEIVVSARKREESIQQVPVAVSALSTQDLEKMDAQNMMDLTARAPNFLAPQNSVAFGAPSMYMRGAGRAEVNWNAENAVAVFVDDVYLQATPAMGFDMIDFESVEVLRGPQGTLYGRNATTGAVKFTPRRPELQNRRLKATATVGSNDRMDVKLSASMPLITDELGVQFDIYRVENDGYITRVNETNQELDDEFAGKKAIGGRIGLLWVASDTLEFELNFDGREENNGSNLFVPIQPADPTSFPQLLSKRGDTEFNPVFGEHRVAGQALLGDGFDLSGYGLVFKGSWETDIGKFKSITGYRWYDEDYFSQLGGRGIPSTLFGVTLYTHVDSFNRFKQFTQELQFSTTIGDSFDVVAGLYYFQNDWSQLQYNGILFPVEFSPSIKPGATQSFGGVWLDTFQDSESYAAYIDATWQVHDRISLFFGGRYLEDKKEVDYETRFEGNVIPLPGFPLTTKEKWNKFTPRVGLEWQATDDIMLYASYAEGFRSGVLEGARATTAALAASWLDPEIVETIEFGIKAEWFDKHLRTNVTVFLSDYSDKVDLISPEEAATADAEINGVEVELSWLVSDALTIWASAGFMDAEYTDADADHPIFNPDPTGFAPGLDADPIVTPDYSFSIGADYYMQLSNNRGSIDFSLMLRGVDDHYNGLGVENYDSEIVESYEVLSARLTYHTPDGKWNVTLGGDNILDETYWTAGFFGAVPEVASRHYADGASWYLSLQYNFE